jgi:ParB-like nuclease domain
MANLQEETVRLDQLLLDPNNYRFHDKPDFVAADPARFHEAGVQERASRRLRDDSMLALKNSILTNGFLTFERLVVRRYDSDGEDLYLVVEGNRRTAALRWIAQDDEAGVPVKQDVLDALQNLPVIVIGEGSDPALHLSLMGVRHVGGINEWGGYQRARLVTQLRDEYGLETGEVANRLGMKPHEVNRRYRAYRALSQMEEDEEFGDLSEATMYPLFHEAVSLPIVREWLGWDEGSGQFTDDHNRESFYQLITGTEREDGSLTEPKITTYSQVRELRAILDLPEAKRILLDPDRSFHEAVGVAKADEIARSWATEVAQAISALNSVGALELARLGEDDVQEIIKLRDMAEQLLETHKKVTV